MVKPTIPEPIFYFISPSKDKNKKIAAINLYHFVINKSQCKKFLHGFLKNKIKRNTQKVNLEIKLIFMDRLFPLPIYTFVKIAYANGGITFKRIKNLGPWLLKTILFEPLRWVELASHNKRIRRHEITKHPVFVLGFYRSGTSYLHQLLAIDNRLGYHSNFQMVLPEIMLSTEKILSPFFEWICRTFNIKDSVHRVPLSFRFPGEEDATMTTSVNPRGAQWGYFFPKMMNEQFRKYVLFDNIPGSELEAWKKEFVFLLKKISLANNGKRLVLKSPPNTARIKTLLSIFPDAKFVFIHRNPYEVYLSNKKFWGVTQSIYAMGATGSVDVNAVILDTYSQMMDRYLLEKQEVPEGQLVEVAYESLMQKPIQTMQKIYNGLNLDDLDHCEYAMRSFIEKEKSFVRLKHEIPEDERQRVTETLEPYVRHWNYPLQ